MRIAMMSFREGDRPEGSHARSQVLTQHNILSIMSFGGFQLVGCALASALSWDEEIVMTGTRAGDLRFGFKIVDIAVAL